LLSPPEASAKIGVAMTATEVTPDDQQRLILDGGRTIVEPGHES